MHAGIPRKQLLVDRQLLAASRVAPAAGLRRTCSDARREAVASRPCLSARQVFQAGSRPCAAVRRVGNRGPARFAGRHYRSTNPCHSVEKFNQSKQDESEKEVSGVRCEVSGAVASRRPRLNLHLARQTKHSSFCHGCRWVRGGRFSLPARRLSGVAGRVI